MAPSASRHVAPALAVLTMAAAASCILLHRRRVRRSERSDKPEAERARLATIHELPSSLPLLGNLIDVLRHGDEIHGWFTRLSLQFNGEPFALRIPGMPDLLVLCRPELFEEVTNDHFAVFVKGNLQYEIVRDLLGDALFAADGQRWHRQRRIAAKFFSAPALRAFMVSSMKKNMLQMCEILESRVSDGHLVDLSKLLHQFTLQTFIEIGLGISDQFIGSPISHPLELAADTAPAVVERRGMLPPWLWKLERRFRIGPEGRMAKVMDGVYDWLRPLVQKSLHKLSTKDDHSEQLSPGVKSVVELFADNVKQELEGQRTEDLVDFLLTFILAARDTTALALCWFFYALAKHPEVEAKIRDELKAQCAEPTGDSAAYVTSDQVRRLTYLEATIQETLRLYPVIPQIRRQATDDVVLSGDLFVKKDQFVTLSAYVLARSPHVWGPDASKFKPERWIFRRTGQMVSVPTSVAFTFSSGPRSCLGKNLAMMEIRVVAANLLKRYKFEVDLSSNDGSYVAAPALIMKYPLVTRVYSSM